MKLKQLFIWAMLLVCASVSAQMQNLPVDPDLRIGKLNNGLTYYIRHNNYPEKVASFYIAQKVGSVQENDDQRGLAHLLEHMAFNGTDHFRDNSLQEYLRSIGVEYGRNLNAYTSTDKTVYYITDVPTTRVSALDSCMLILKDWSNGITLDSKAIDAERDVVHNEYRMRIVGTQKILEKTLPEIYSGSKYGERFPIGLMEVIDGCSPETLRAYYRKWYRPDNQGIIIVGDIDVDRTEQKIKELFDGITVPADAAKVEPVPVPDNNEGIFVVGKDKEQTIPLFLVFMKYDTTPDEMKNTMPYLIAEYAQEMISEMANARFNEVAQDPESALLQASVSAGSFLVARTKDALTIQVLPKEGREIEGLQAVIREMKRIRDFGFTATEYERAKSEYLSKLEKDNNNKDKQKTSDLCDLYVNNFLDGKPAISVSDKYTIMNQILPMLSVDVASQIAQQLICGSDTNLVVLALMQDKEGKQLFTPADMKNAVASVRTEKLEAYVDNVKQEPLMTELPKKGSIVSEKENKTLGYKELTLSNGAKVQLKKTDFNAEEILMKAVSPGGESMFGAKDNCNLQFFTYILSQSALGNYMHNDLQKALAGKQTETSFELNSVQHGLSAKSTPKDLETMMQLVYLNFTNVNKDEKAVKAILDALALQLKNISLNSQIVFQDSTYSTMFNNNPRYRFPTAENIQSINYDRVIEMTRQMYGNAANFTFSFVGNFDEAALRPLIEQYIASLPSKGKADLKMSEIRTLFKGNVTNRFEKEMENPQAMASEIWRSNNVDYNLNNVVLTEMTGKLLDMVFLREIRENLSAAYNAGAEGELETGGLQTYITLTGTAMLNPEKVDIALPEFQKGVDATIKNPNLEDLNKVKQIMLKQADVDANTNKYWIRVLDRYNRFGVDIYTDFKKCIEAVKTQNISSFLQDIMKSGNHAEVVMTPKK